MNFIQAVSTCFRKYATFSGRARRSEFWYFCLFCTLVSTAVSLIFGDMSLMSTLFAMGTLVPCFAVSWRRMHDIGKAGTWALIAFVPIVGFILQFIWCCRDSQPGENAYGPNPKENAPA